MKTFTLSMIIFLLFPQSSFSKNRTLGKIKKSDSSIVARSKKNIVFTTGLGVNYAGVSYQFDSQYILNRHVLIGTKISIYNRDERKVNSTALKAKFFPTNSFYLTTSIFHRHYRNYDYNNWFTHDEIIWGASNKTRGFRDTGVSFSIGNQWFYRYFTFGVDWVGFYSGVVKHSGVYNNSLIRQTSINLLNVQLGYAF